MNANLKNDTYTTLRGNVISSNETGTHCYMWSEGHKGERVRIKKAEYEQIIREDELGRKLAAEVEAAVEATEESITTEETQEIAKELAPKKKKPIKSRAKKIKVGGMEFGEDGISVILTPAQVEFFKHMPDTHFWENGLDSALWIDVLCDEISGMFAGKPMTVGAMISTLREKKMLTVGVERMNGKKAKFLELTELGKRAAKEIGLQ